MMVVETKKSTGGQTALVSVLFVLLLVSLVMGLSAFVLYARHTADWQQYMPYPGELRLLTNRISGFASDSGAGEEEAFADLRESRQEFIQLMDELKTSLLKGVPAAPDSVQQSLQEVESVWLELRSQVDSILNSREAIMSMHGALDGIHRAMPDLLGVSESAAGRLVENKASGNQVYHATRQLFIAQLIQTAMTRALAGGTPGTLAADQVEQNLNELKSVVHALLKGDETLGIEAVTDENIQQDLLEVSAILGDVDDSLRLLQEGMEGALPALQVLSEGTMGEQAEVAGAGTELAATAGELEQKLSGLKLAYTGNASGPVLGPVEVKPTLIILLGAVAIGLLLVMGLLLLINARKRRKFSVERGQLDQESVHLLLDEMSHIADGDLSVEATVGDGITGAIADSVNQITGTMRGLVSSINDAAIRAYSSVQENRSNIMHLAEASEHQHEQIGAASSKVNTVAQALTVMAGEAGRATSVAVQSVELVEKGDRVMQQTVSGMDKIGKQISQASMCVRRLDENLQASGEIVELVEDIADQTNILALNAAMQAAVAGEAGRGFAVVADGVQKQAERFARVSKEIEAMVQASQTEAGKAVSSMESSTEEVASGAGLAENAGQIVDQIKVVSGDVSGIVSKFAEYAQIQSSSALSISDSMGIIREISQQNSENTENAVSTIGELADEIEGFRAGMADLAQPGKRQSS